MVKTPSYNYIRCECGCRKMICLYNYKDAIIEFFCSDCDKLAQKRHVLYNPLENIQNDIIDLLKWVFVNDRKGMIEWVKTNLKVTKVTSCQDMELLSSCWEILYKRAEGVSYGGEDF